MEEAIKLSVVVSCYKQENYIEECLNSIFTQEVDFNYEVIIADDCSPDKTREVIKQFYAKYPEKIKLMFQEVNVGAARNYITVHNLAQGKYVAHFDGDDVMLPGKLQAQVDIMEANPHCHLVFHRARYFSDDRSYLAETGSLFTDCETVFFTPQELARWGTIAVHSSYMYRRSTRKTREYSQDFMEWFFAFESLLEGGIGACINQILVEYRCNPAGNAYLSTKVGREKAYLIIIGHVIDYFNSTPEFKSDFYAHQLINIVMYIKNIRKVKWFMLQFLLKNIEYFRFGKVKEAIQVRKMVGPSKKIR
ncbi:MAG: glycosyltransferase family 2 protein [Methylococcaceae bacterium]